MNDRSPKKRKGIVGMQCFRMSIDKDTWTEINDQVKSFLKIINDTSGDYYELHKDSLKRLVIILSHYLVEVIFWDSCNKKMCVDKAFSPNKEFSEEYSKSPPSFTRAIHALAKDDFFKKSGIDFGKEPFQSLKDLTTNRNIGICQ